ncbi:MAG: GNAT family N-acetyltransferase [Eubacteriales bacterium]|nr:GNAT family N-acetyltransferase [Eubacteriales bacterium]
MHIAQYEKDPSFYGWAVTLDDAVIGSIGLFNVDEDSEQCELGYSIGIKQMRHLVICNSTQSFAPTKEKCSFFLTLTLRNSLSGPDYMDVILLLREVPRGATLQPTEDGLV